MPIYRLWPVEESKNEQDWVRSTRCGVCHANAPDAHKARQLANRQFSKAAGKINGVVLNSPWLQDHLVNCIEVAHMSGEAGMPEPSTVTIPRGE